MAPQQEEIDCQEGSSSKSMLVTPDGVKKPFTYLGKEGVSVVANTLGELDTVLECFSSTGLKVPVNALNIGFAVTKDDVVVASLNNKKEYAAIFGFKVEATPEALGYANQLGVKIHSCFEKDLFPQAKAFLQNI